MIPFEDVLWVAVYAALSALAVAALGLPLLWVMRSRSVAMQLALVSVATVVATGAGIVVITLMMILDAHDRAVVLTVVVVAGLVGLLVSAALGRRLIAANRTLVRSVRSDPYRVPQVRLPAELSELAREFDRTYGRLAEAHAREQALESSRRELVAWVSHDLRTPLAGLRAMAEALEDEVIVDAETVRRFHGRMRIEVDRLSEMVDDLFELSRIHAGVLSLSRHLVGLDDLVADVIAGSEALARAKGVRLEGRAAWPGVPLQADATELGRALRNVVVNAIRHTPTDGTVEIRCGLEDGQACVMVSDACGGIPDEDLPRVFDVAFRGEQARSPGGGAGLGLAIARGIVEAHSGEIGVSNTGPGCRFVIRLPAAG